MFPVTEFFIRGELKEANLFSLTKDDSDVEITTEVNELIFGNIRITLEEKEGLLLIEDISTDNKERTRGRKLYIGPSDYSKSKPTDPAGKRKPPKPIITH